MEKQLKKSIHLLNNKLMIIGGFAELAKEYTPVPDRRYKHLIEIIKATGEAKTATMKMMEVQLGR